MNCKVTKHLSIHISHRLEDEIWPDLVDEKLCWHQGYWVRHFHCRARVLCHRSVSLATFCCYVEHESFESQQVQKSHWFYILTQKLLGAILSHDSQRGILFLLFLPTRMASLASRKLKSNVWQFFCVAQCDNSALEWSEFKCSHSFFLTLSL